MSAVKMTVCKGNPGVDFSLGVPVIPEKCYVPALFARLSCCGVARGSGATGSVPTSALHGPRL